MFESAREKRSAARSVALRNRALAIAARPQAAETLAWFIEHGRWMTPDNAARLPLSPVERAKEIRRIARKLVAADDEHAVAWIQRARVGRLRLEYEAQRA